MRAGAASAKHFEKGAAVYVYPHEKSQGYAVSPSVGKAAAVAGAAFGKGEVFEKGKLVSYAAIAQATIGVQLGGGMFTEIIAFENKPTFERFRRGRFALAASASAVMIKAGAAASAGRSSS